MDENGDAEGNYTLLSMDPERPPGLYPLAVMHKSAPVMFFKCLFKTFIIFHEISDTNYCLAVK